MFLVHDNRSEGVRRINSLMQSDPSVGALLAVVHFEWCLRRAIIGLGRKPTKEIRSQLEDAHGIKRLKELWAKEVRPNVGRTLPRVLDKQWGPLTVAYKLRNTLVHGVRSCGPGYARSNATNAIAAAELLDTFCMNMGVDIYSTLAVRRAKKEGPAVG
jgi:hypothetical protein